MFDFMVKILAENGKGIHAYRLCAEAGYRAAKSDPAHAAALFLLAATADEFVEVNERMPVTTKEIEEAFARFSAHADRLGAAFSGGSDADRLAALNAVAGALTAQR
jgi:hypothetical protein